jgi:hypothetical protein
MSVDAVLSCAYALFTGSGAAWLRCPVHHASHSYDKILVKKKGGNEAAVICGSYQWKLGIHFDKSGSAQPGWQQKNLMKSPAK